MDDDNDEMYPNPNGGVVVIGLLPIIFLFAIYAMDLSITTTQVEDLLFDISELNDVTYHGILKTVNVFFTLFYPFFILYYFVDYKHNFFLKGSILSFFILFLSIKEVVLIPFFKCFNIENYRIVQARFSLYIIILVLLFILQCFTVYKACSNKSSVLGVAIIILSLFSIILLLVIHIKSLIQVRTEPALNYDSSEIHIGYFSPNEINMIHNNSYFKDASFKNRFICSLRKVKSFKEVSFFVIHFRVIIKKKFYFSFGLK